MVSYSKLLQKLSEKGMSKTALAKELGISSRTIAKIGREERISDHVLKRVAAYFGCQCEDLFSIYPDNPLLRELREEKESGLYGGIYHELQVRMTYNSNHIEGSRLSEEQTRYIFETNTVDVSGGVPVDDIIETVNHFRAIDYVIDAAEEPLSEGIIKTLHRILKSGTKDSTLSWFAVGDYKQRANVVGGREAVKPKDVPARMEKLTAAYESIQNVTFEDIVRFHYEFERIHPFQDGNGRVGRLIALKECLRFSIVPFIIEDSKKIYYYRGLSEYEREPGFLIGTCLDGQNSFKRLMEMFAEN